MARKASQIKNVLIKTKTEGSKEAIAELNSVDKAIGQVNNSTAELISKSRAIAKAFGTITQATRGLERSSKTIADVGKALNTAFSGNAKQTKAVDSYATNIEFLDSIMREFNGTAQRTAKYMNATNNAMQASPLNNIASSIEILVGQMQELVEGIDELNQGSRISNARLKQVREYIADVGQAADLTTEQIDDLTRGITGFNGGMERSEGAMKRYNNGLRRMNAQGRSTTKGFSDIVFGSNPLVNAYAAIAVNVYAASEAFRVLNEAANFDRLLSNLGTFSAGVSGINIRQLATDLEAASGYALSFKESIDLSAQGTAFNFTADQMRKLTDLTRKASIALGRDFSDSMDRVIRGIAKQEIEILDEIGVVTKLTTAFEKYAKANGKSIDELSEFERQLALTNEVMGQLEARYSGVDAQATSWEVLGANVKNATKSGLVFISEFLDPAVTAINDLIERSGRLNSTREGGLAIIKDQQKTFSTSLEQGSIRQAITSYASLETTLEKLNAAREKEQKTLDAENKKLAKNAELVKALEDKTKRTGRIDPRMGVYTGGAEIAKSKKVLAEIDSQIAIVNQGLANQKQALKALGLTQFDNLEQLGAEMKSLENSSVEVSRQLGSLALASNSLNGPLSEVIKPLSGMNLQFENLKDVPGEAEKMKESFKELSGALSLGPSIKDFESLEDALKSVNKLVQDSELQLAKLTITSANQEGGGIALMEAELKLLNERIDKQIPLGGIVNNKELEREREVLKVKIQQAKAEKDIADTFRELETAQAIREAHLKSTSALESEILDTAINTLKVKVATLKEDDSRKKALEEEIALLLVRKGIAQEDEKTASRSSSLSTASKVIDFAAERASQSERTQVEFAQMKLQIRRQEIELMDDGIAKEEALVDLALQQLDLKGRAAAATAKDAQNMFAQLKELNGLSDLQQDFLTLGESLSEVFAKSTEGFTGLSALIDKMGEEGSSLNNVGSVISEALSGGDASGALTEFSALIGKMGEEGSSLNNVGSVISEALSGADASGALTEFMPGLGDSLTDAAEKGTASFSDMIKYLTNDSEALTDVGIAVTNALGSMYQSLTEQKIAGIDREIEAEKRRDGKSKESLEKIKKLEAQKIKENAKSAKAQVVVSTSVAIMKAFETFGPWGAIPAAIMAGFGAMQISQINSAANGQLAALNSGGTDGMTITGGDRNNMVDVSSSAKSGESAYFGGLSNNLPGRAGGGDVEAGDAVVLGEVGPEVFIPDVPGSVVPAGRAAGMGGGFGEFNLSINAVDSKSFLDQVDIVRAEIFDRVDEELRARYNTTLENL